MLRRFAVFLAAAVALAPVLACPAAQIKIGVIASTTGSAASLGIPQRNGIVILPKGIGKLGAEHIILDDGSDSARGHRGPQVDK